MNKYSDLEVETLETLLSNEEVLDIQPLSIGKSPIKPSALKPSASKTSPSKSTGVRTFFGKQPKACTNNAFKPLGVGQMATQKPINNNPVSKSNLVYSLMSEEINNKMRFTLLLSNTSSRNNAI